MAPDSKRDLPLSRSMIAGMRLFGLILRKSGLKFADVDGMCSVVELAFLEHDGDLAAVGCRPRVKIDHRGVLVRRAGLERGGGLNVRR
jgi:hypothetical protein